jgi:hypothetical protein
MFNFVNLTPHKIRFLNASDEQIQEVEPSGQLARVQSFKEEVGFWDFPVFEESFGDIEGLPEPAVNTIFVVSGMVLQAMKDNPEQYDDYFNKVIAPLTDNSAVRYQNGHIDYVTGFKIFQG